VDGLRDVLRIEVEVPHVDVALLRLVGEVDLLTAPALRQQLTTRTRRHRDVVVDLAAVQFLGSAGLRVLVDAHRCAADHANRLHLAGAAHRRVAVPLRITGLDRLLRLSEHSAAVLAARLAVRGRC
jgi:anti-sigma B factor antagonist